MKTPHFWYEQEDAFLPVLLTPFSWIFQAATWIRRATAKPHRARVPLICIGNVVAGGAGKTPTALVLARLLQQKGEKPVFVTRGYGGSLASQRKAVCIDLERHSAAEVGDEALLLAARAPTWVCRDRVAAIRQAQTYGTCIIMDDGFQNPHVMADSALLVVDGETGLGNGHIIPAGPLREPLEDALRRASAVIIIGVDRHNTKAKIKLPLFNAHLEPRLPQGFPRHGRFVAFAGIGRPEKFFETARTLGLDLAETVGFADHHTYTAADIDTLRLMAEERGAHLLTTEKDIVRLPDSIRSEIVTLPVELIFNDPGTEERLLRLCLSLHP